MQPGVRGPGRVEAVGDVGDHHLRVGGVRQRDGAAISAQRRETALSHDGHQVRYGVSFGHLQRHRAQGRQALSGDAAVLLGGVSGGDIDEVQPDAAAVLGGGTHLEPGVQRGRVVGIEADHLALLSSAAVTGLEVGAHGGGEQRPDHGANQLLTGQP